MIKQFFVYEQQEMLLRMLGIAKFLYFRGGRGCGKSFLLFLAIIKFVDCLPGAYGLLVGKTYSQISGIFLKNLKTHLKAFGILEYDKKTRKGHYIVGTRPPREWEKNTIVLPDDYKNIIYFCNGSYLQMVSLNRSDLARGHNAFYAVVDEVQELNEQDFKMIVSASVRQSKNLFFDNPHVDIINTIVMCGTAPWTNKQNWVNGYKEKALHDEFLEAEYNKKKREEDPPFKRTYFYVQARTKDNPNLPADYEPNLREELGPIAAAIELDGEVRNFIENGFYPALMDSHFYKLSGDFREIRSDYEKNKPLDMSIDFGAHICTMVLGQEHRDRDKKEYRCIDYLYETEKTKLKKPIADQSKDMLILLLETFARAYPDKSCSINVYGDQKSGFAKSSTSHAPFHLVMDFLRKNGYRATLCAKNENNPGHEDKYRILNYLLNRENPSAPAFSFNGHTCAALRVAMESAPVTNEYKKDKGSEKDENIDQEYATHGTDAWDYLIMSKFERFYAPKSGRGYSVVGL